MLRKALAEFIGCRGRQNEAGFLEQMAQMDSMDCDARNLADARALLQVDPWVVWVDEVGEVWNGN